MVDLCRGQLLRHKEASNAFMNGSPEQAIVWEDDHGVICRARLDWLHAGNKIIDDYKTVGGSANPESIARKILSDGWDIQEAFYRRGIRKLFGGGIEPEFRFIAQEVDAPHALSVVALDNAFRWLGDSKVQRAIDTWAKCLKENKWPGHPDRICYPVLPIWAEEHELKKELEKAS
jgi:hypothetical protein